MTLEQVTAQNYIWWDKQREAAIESQERAETMIRRYAPIVMGQLAMFGMEEYRGNK